LLNELLHQKSQLDGVIGATARHPLIMAASGVPDQNHGCNQPCNTHD
jgi:hypothetical protein